MSKFFVPQRYDSNVAEEGVWFHIDDDNGNHYGRFKCRLIDDHSQSGKLALKRIRNKYAAQIRTKALKGQYDSIRIVLCEFGLIDWELPVDPSAKKATPVPFSIDNALEYFAMDETEWVLIELTKLASDITNFAPEESVNEVEDVSGN